MYIFAILDAVVCLAVVCIVQWFGTRLNDALFAVTLLVCVLLVARIFYQPHARVSLLATVLWVVYIFLVLAHENVHWQVQETRCTWLASSMTLICAVFFVALHASMAVRHKDYLIEGVQFHPESIMTEDGKKILSNFIKEVKEKK